MATSSGWMMSSVMGVRAVSSTVLPVLWDSMTVLTLKMPGSDVKLGTLLLVWKELSDFVEEAAVLRDVWKYAI